MRYHSSHTLAIILAIGLSVFTDIGCSSRHEQPSDEAYEVFRTPFPAQIAQVLNEPDRFTLFSIEGENEILAELTEHSFHGFRILGKTEIRDAEQRKSLVDALNLGIRKAQGPALCFAPRHGISAVQGERQLDLVICFECAQIYVMDGHDKPIFKTQTSDDPAAVFNKVLTTAGVPLANPPGSGTDKAPASQ